MTVIQGVFHHEVVKDETINRSLNEILSNNILLSMASIKEEKYSWIHTAFYAYSSKLRFYYVSPPSAQHSKNIDQNQSVAVSIFDTHQNPTDQKSGLQIFGMCRRATGEEVAEGLTLYSERFPWLSKYIKTPDDFDKGILESKLYIITPHTIKMLDEAVFGEEKWVIVSLQPFASLCYDRGYNEAENRISRRAPRTPRTYPRRSEINMGRKPEAGEAQSRKHARGKCIS